MSTNIDLSRREFLQTSATFAMATSVTGSALAQTTQSTSPPMPTRPLGKTGLTVPILQMGGSFQQSPVLTKRALELGINFFDTSVSYMRGKAEGIVGSALKQLAKRQDYVIVTKGHPKTPDQILGTYISQSLERLQTDYVDVWFLHGLDNPDQLTDPDWQAALDAAKKSGKTHFVGFSCHGKRTVDLLNAAAKTGHVDVIMFKHNFRTYGHDELNRAIDTAHKAGIGLIAMKTQGALIDYPERLNPFAQAGLSKHQAALKLVWADPRIASACSEMTSLNILEENAAAARQPLSTTERGLLSNWAQRTAGSYCAGGCGLCARQCETATDERIAIADTLRYLMYHEAYGRRRDARRLFAELAAHTRPAPDRDYAAAQHACPLNVSVASLMTRATHCLT